MILRAAPTALAGALAHLHAAAFAASGRPWSAAEITALTRGGALCLDGAPPQGFALARVAADEAELLTIAVAPDRRGRGVGARLMALAEGWARDAGAAAMLLEVDAANTPARRLYAARRYGEVGLRRGYYVAAGAAATDAMVMRRAL